MSGAEGGAAAEVKVKTVQAVVADGHTVNFGGGVTFGPGEKVELPAQEVARLRKSGHLVDPSAKPIPKGDGPTFSAQDGPTVKSVAG